MTYRESAIEFLWRSALTDQSKALASLQLLLDHGTGIGDHSTEDLHSNLEDALSTLARSFWKKTKRQKYFM